MRDAWRLLARNRNFRLLLSANLLSSIGNWILGIGMTFYVYAVTGSVLASGLMLLADLLPMLLLSSVAGVLVDRWDHRRTMVVTNVLLAAGLVPLFLVRHEDQLWIIYLVVFVQGALEQVFTPAEAAVISRVVPADQLVAVNALNGQNRQIARLAGAAAGGVLAAAGGITLVASVDLVSYLLAAGLVAMLRAQGRPEIEVAAGPAGFGRDWLDGIRLCFGNRELKTLFVFQMMSGFGEGVVAVLLAPLIVGVLHASGGEYGAVMSTQAIGGIAGALAVAAVSRRVTPRGMLGHGALIFGVIALLIAVYPVFLPELWPIFVLIGLAGLPSAAARAGLSTLQQLHSPQAYFGRIFGAISTGSAVAITLGTVLATLVGDVLGILVVISLQGLIHIAAGPYVLVRLRSGTASPEPDPAERVGGGSIR